MKDLKISLENKKNEDAIFTEIARCIDKKQNFVFDAGAGSGKTYSLIQSLKYILSKYTSQLKTHNQLVRCITYTNVAAKEIKIRLGNTELVKVSTIHDFLWEEIRLYQDELVDIHKKHIENQIMEAENELKTEKWAGFYIKICDKLSFNELLYNNAEVYYKNKHKNAKDFRNEMKIFDSACLENISNFKHVADNILKIHRYTLALDNITKKVKDNKVDYTKVIYNSQISYDRLASMQFSHDTLISYSLQLIGAYKTLQKVISDKYPYILVDEYQDTSPEVVKILQILAKYASNNLLIGYYGDKKQKIYSTGVGDDLLSLHKNLMVIKKEYNRRSAKRIIDVGSLIRNDSLKQKTIYENCPEGLVNFYIGQNIDKFIVFFHKKWSITLENQLNCLFLKNEDIAFRAGFEKIYNFFKNSPYYRSGINYTLLRDHMLSKDPEKLGKVQTFIYYLLDLRSKLNNPDTLIPELINKNVLKGLSIKELKELILVLRNIKGNTFKDYCSSFFNVLSTKNGNVKRALVSFLKEENIISMECFYRYLSNELFNNYTDDDCSLENMIEDFVNQDMIYFNNWYNYISDRNLDDIKYHTYHGTKGEEFNNVLIIMESDFGKNNKNFFGDLIKCLSNPSEDDTLKIKDARNLFYVAVTRAKYNLAILYTGILDEDQKHQIENIFGEIDEVMF